MTRMAFDPRTKAYVERRTGEGLSKREVIRVLKRYVAREVYRYLPRPSGAPVWPRQSLTSSGTVIRPICRPAPRTFSQRCLAS